MNNQRRLLLQANKNELISTLDVIFIIDELYQKGAIVNLDYDRLVAINNRSDRTRYFIDNLIRTGNNDSYEAFVDSLMKDHRWLWEKFNMEMSKDSGRESFEDSLSRGDVPRLPEHYVQRIEQEHAVTLELKNLERHEILALHGMTGSGKTVVTIGALKNNRELINEGFGGYVFWLNLSNCRTEDNIVDEQTKLLRKAKSADGRRDSSIYMNSSISVSSVSSINNILICESNVQENRDLLKETFSKPPLRDALLVLDEVNDASCVKAFDIGCKIMVTTRDTNVVANPKPKKIVTIKNSFKENETLQLFASCLDIPITNLPKEAMKIHETCKGAPLQIALLGAVFAENRERMIDDKKLWKYYVDKLVHKDFYSILLKNDNFNPNKVIEMCINTLPDHILPLFKKLAVLPENVKVSADVLSVIWKGVNDVQSILKRLKNKCLIIEIYDKESKNYVYEIPDSIMSSLKTFFNDQSMKELHSSLLVSYGYNDLDNVPIELKSSYLAQYIGYHIYKTDNLNYKWNLFNKLYLDLNFIGNKLRLTGPADVIIDLQRYEMQICKNDLDTELLIGIKSYIAAHGNDLYRYPDTDIVQNILQHVHTGALYTKAYDLAQNGCRNHELYFEFLHPQQVESINHTTIDVEEVVCAVSFLTNFVLVGTMSGKIKIYHIFTNKLKKELQTSSHRIIWVAACPISLWKIAALSVDGSLHIWCIDELKEDISVEAIEETDIEEASEADEKTITENCSCLKSVVSKTKDHIMNCHWANNHEVLFAHTSKEVMSFGVDGTLLKIFDNWESNREITCCNLTGDDKSIILGSYLNNSFYADIINISTKKKLISFEQTSPILHIFGLPVDNNSLLVLTETEVLKHSWQTDYTSTSLLTQGSHIQNYRSAGSQTIIQSQAIKENLYFISAVVNRSGSLLFVSTNDSRIICVCLKTNAYIFDLNNRRGNVISMDVGETWSDYYMDSSDVLLSGTGNVENSVKVWFLDTTYVAEATNRQRKARLTSKFDASFLDGINSPHTPLTPGYFTPQNESANSTPRRINSFVVPNNMEKKIQIKKTISLDKHSLKPLNLKGINNGNEDNVKDPLLAVVDDKNNIQIHRGRKILTEISERLDNPITTVQISPCSQYVFFGLKSGTVKKFIMRSKETRTIMDIAYSTVQYMEFVNKNLLIVSWKNRCLMAYRFLYTGDWVSVMLENGNAHLGSQEILNDIIGTKLMKNQHTDTTSNSGSEASSSSPSKPTERLFPVSDSKNQLSKHASLVKCFWVPELGMISVEDNGTVKLWDEELKLTAVLIGRQIDLYVSCAAFNNSILAICDDSGRFQTYRLKVNGIPSLQLIQEQQLNNKIACCDITQNGQLLAMGLDSGNILIWHIQGKFQIAFLKHHQTHVQTLSFSPAPEKINPSGSVAQSPTNISPFQYGANLNDSDSSDNLVTPQVLVSMATEIVWWNITYVIKARKPGNGVMRNSRNILTPVSSPLDSRNLSNALENMHISTRNKNHFFGDDESWEEAWKGKRCKTGAKNKSILACIKLTGVTAKKILHNEKFSSFVTVDNQGYIHMMNLMRFSSENDT